MAVDPTDIIAWYHERVREKGEVFGHMRVIRQHYAGYVQTAIPELDFSEQAATANLIFTAIEQYGNRISSVQPSVICPPIKPGQQKSEAYARIRRLAILSWWDQNSFDRKQRRRARQLIAYGMAPVILRPDYKHEIPRWMLLDPFGTFPGKHPDLDAICPPDCILSYTRTYDWLMRRFPDAMAIINKSNNNAPDTSYDVLEYIDDEECVMLVLGKPVEPVRAHQYAHAYLPEHPGQAYAVLSRSPNPLGKCTVVYPTRIGLDGIQGQFDGMPALAQHQARAMALLQIANERAIFPEHYLVARPNESVHLIARPDGRAGEPGQIEGGDVKELNVVPPPQILDFLQYLQEQQQQTGSVSSDFGGQAPTNVRTGRAGEQLIGATVDYWIQEAQETLGLGYRHENELAIHMSRCLWGASKKSFYVIAKNVTAPVDYIPDVHFETTANQVAWPNPGSDANSLAIGLGQRVGQGEMSKRSARELDPYIQDAELEQRRIDQEAMDQALMAAISQAIAGGQIGPVEVASIIKAVNSGDSLEDAVNTAHKAAQKTQAAQQAQTAPDPTDPNQQPGMMAPGMQQQLGIGPNNPPGEPIPPPSPSLAHLGSLLSATRPRSDQGSGPPPGNNPLNVGGQ